MNAGEHQENDLGNPKFRILKFPSDSKGSRAGEGASMLKVSLLQKKMKDSGQKY